MKFFESKPQMIKDAKIKAEIERDNLNISFSGERAALLSLITVLMKKMGEEIGMTTVEFLEYIKSCVVLVEADRVLETSDEV